MFAVNLLSKIFIGIGLIGTYAYADKSPSHQQVFTDIYTKGVWGSNDKGEGFSGGGSLLQNTKEYRAFLQQFMKTHSVRTVVDAGCGDWEFSRYIDWTGIQYLGFDVVAHVIQKDIERYGTSNIRFINANFLAIDLPAADLLICKHVLQHLSNQDIISFLPQLKKFKYCLITNQVDPDTLSGDNADTVVGGAHKIDLSKAPFNVAGKKVLTYCIGGPVRSGGSIHQVFLIDNTLSR